MDVVTKAVSFIFSGEGAVVLAIFYALFRGLSEVAPLIGRLLAVIPGMDSKEMASKSSDMMRNISKVFAWVLGGDTSKIVRQIDRQVSEFSDTLNQADESEDEDERKK